MSKGPGLIVFWGDTRELLSKEEMRRIIKDVFLESIDNDEVLLRDRSSMRLVVVIGVGDGKNLYCNLCKNEISQERYGADCPEFAKCILEGTHRTNEDP